MTTKAKIRKFKEFHAKNPDVYIMFRYFMLEMLDKTHIVSARMCYERTRWDMFMEKDAEANYKMNNNYLPAYTRIFLRENKHYKPVVELRVSIFDDIYLV